MSLGFDLRRALRAAMPGALPPDPQDIFGQMKGAAVRLVLGTGMSWRRWTDA